MRQLDWVEVGLSLSYFLGLDLMTYFASGSERATGGIFARQSQINDMDIARKLYAACSSRYNPTGAIASIGIGIRC